MTLVFHLDVQYICVQVDGQWWYMHVAEHRWKYDYKEQTELNDIINSLCFVMNLT